MIEVKNLTYRDIIQNISFKLSKGDYTAIIGPNGAGKSTLLKLILSLIPKSSGEILIEKNLKIAYLPQRVSQIDNNFPITALEVVKMGLAHKMNLFKSESLEDLEQLERVMQKVDILHLKNRLISKLSGGERQKVMIARALVSNPSLLIFDEPNTGIDQDSQKRFYQLLKDLNDDGKTILFVTHDIDNVINDVKSVLCINKKVIYCKSPKEIFNCPHMKYS